MEGTVDDGIELLRRRQVLEACLEEPLTRRELTDRIGVSRTTAYRATVALENDGLLADGEGEYRTTQRGAALLAVANAFLKGFETVSTLEPLLEVVDHPALAANAHRFVDPRVVVADASNPYRIVEHVLERLASTARSRGVIVSASAAKAIERAPSTMAEIDSIERIFAASALEAHEVICADGFEAATGGEAFSLLVADDADVPFSFAIDDEGVTITGHDPATGLPTVHVESDRPEARVWLEAVYDRCLEAATPV